MKIYLVLDAAPNGEWRNYNKTYFSLEVGWLLGGQTVQ